MVHGGHCSLKQSILTRPHNFSSRFHALHKMSWGDREKKQPKILNDPDGLHRARLCIQNCSSSSFNREREREETQQGVGSFKRMQRLSIICTDKVQSLWVDKLFEVHIILHILHSFCLCRWLLHSTKVRARSNRRHRRCCLLPMESSACANSSRIHDPIDFIILSNTCYIHAILFTNR